MDLDIYPMQDGIADRARLISLQQFLRPTTLSLFDRVGVRPGMACLDLGCGIGEVVFDLAQLVGPEGRAVGIDIDDARIEMAREDAAANGLSNVEFLVGDVRPFDVTEKFDLVYARILLSHLKDPASLLAKMRQMLNPGGFVIIEDIDYSGYYCYPDLPSFRRSIELLYEMKRVMGGSAEFGKELPMMLVDAGLSRVEAFSFQHVELSGDIKKYLPRALAGGMADWIVALDLATEGEMERILADLNEFADNPRTIMGTPRYCQVWGNSEQPE